MGRRKREIYFSENIYFCFTKRRGAQKYRYRFQVTVAPSDTPSIKVSQRLANLTVMDGNGR
jgi:hypothetical protein